MESLLLLLPFRMFRVRLVCSICLHLQLSQLSQVRQGQVQQAAVADVAEPLCCAQGLFPRGRLLHRDGLQQRAVVDVL